MRSTVAARLSGLSLSGVALLSAAVLGGVTAAQGKGLPKLEWELSGGGKILIYGQINTGVLYYDDGYSGETYAPIDNNNSSSRAGITYSNKVTDWDFEARLEGEYKPFSSNNVSILNDDPDWDWRRTNIRKLEISLKNKIYGGLYIGQGSMASDGTAEVDLSGTTVIAYSLVSDTAGSQLLRDANNAARSGPAIKSAFNNYDGLGRKLRIRYDTPKFHGFGLQASYGEDALIEDKTGLYDIAATYSEKFEAFQVQAALAYADQDNDIRTVDGSASILHISTGLNLTVASGSRDDGIKAGSYVYGKLGLLRDIIPCGPTAFAVDYYKGDDIAKAGNDSTSVGVAIVQNIKDYNTELWLTYREYRYDDPAIDLRDGHALFAGTRIKF